MTQDEIVNHIIQLLQWHKEGLRGTIHQEPYKGDFFRLFAASFNSENEVLTADKLTDIILSRNPEVVDNQTWNDFRSFWSEWTYAWLHLDRCFRETPSGDEPPGG